MVPKGKAIYLLLLCISSIIFIILWIYTLQQFCSATVKSVQRARKLWLLLLLSTFSILLNSSIYLSCIFPNFIIFATYNLWILTDILEVIVLMLGFYLYGEFQIGIIHDMYIPINMKPPAWIKNVFDIIKSIYFITVLAFYSFVYVFDDRVWVFRFYFVLSAVTFVQSLIALCVLWRILNKLNALRAYIKNQSENTKLKKAQKAMRIALFIVGIICFTCIISALFAVEYICNFIPIQFDHTLFLLIMHSVFLMLVIIALFLWMYKKSKWCIVRKHTICDYWGCASFWVFCCGECCLDRKEKQKRTKTEVLLREPTMENTIISNLCTNDTDSKMTDFTQV